MINLFHYYESVHISGKGIALKIAACLIIFMFVDTPSADAQRYSYDKEHESVQHRQVAPPTREIAPAPPTNNPPAPPPPPGKPVQTPIDGGLGLLLAAGGAYAVRRLRKNDETPTDIT